jgi:hypothetical protein
MGSKRYAKIPPAAEPPYYSDFLLKSAPYGPPAAARRINA